jgi:hypothetical protein
VQTLKSFGILEVFTVVKFEARQTRVEKNLEILERHHATGSPHGVSDEGHTARTTHKPNHVENISPIRLGYVVPTRRAQDLGEGVIHGRHVSVLDQNARNVRTLRGRTICLGENIAKVDIKVFL